MNRLLRYVLLVSALGCTPSDDDPPETPALSELPSPAATFSGEPFVTADASDNIHLSWLEKSGDSTYALRYSRLAGETWGPTRTIATRSDFFINWADFPSVTPTSDGRLVAHWLQRSAGGKYTYDVMVSHSANGGETWTAGQLLHRDGMAAEHGFVAVWPVANGGVEAAWLDGRGTVGRDPAHRAMHLATTSIAADASLGEEHLLDLRVCDCCQVAAALTARGPVVAYRDRSEGEIRDIAMVRRVEGTWTAPTTVHDDNWQIAACPVNGPAVDARGDTVVAAWFTGAQDTARVRVAYSLDAGASFGPPQRIDAGNPAGRVDVILLDDGSAAVSWLERTDSVVAEVRVRRVRADGTSGAPVTLARSMGARASGFPRIARRGDALVVAWTQAGDSARVRLAQYRLGALP